MSADLIERVERSPISIMRLARLANVPARRIYGDGTLTPEQADAVRTVLDAVDRGEIAVTRRQVSR